VYQCTLCSIAPVVLFQLSCKSSSCVQYGSLYRGTFRCYHNDAYIVLFSVLRKQVIQRWQKYFTYPEFSQKYMDSVNLCITQVVHTDHFPFLKLEVHITYARLLERVRYTKRLNTTSLATNLISRLAPRE